MLSATGHTRLHGGRAMVVGVGGTEAGAHERERVAHEHERVGRKDAAAEDVAAEARTEAGAGAEGALCSEPACEWTNQEEEGSAHIHREVRG